MAKKLSYYDPRIIQWRDELRREQHSRLLKKIVKRGDNGNLDRRCMGIKPGGSYCREQATEGIYCINCFKRYNRVRKSCVLKPRRVSYIDVKAR